jgi:hypothetical protein
MQNKEYIKRYRKEHAEELRAYRREYYARHKEKMNTAHRKWYSENKEKMALYKKKWLKEHPTYNRVYNLDYLYGFSAEDYQKLVEEYQNRCGICGIELTEPHVDHDHKTGKVRGLLCQTCNLKLDWAWKYREEIQRYMERHQR